MRQFFSGTLSVRRRFLHWIAAGLLALPLSAKAADPLKEIRIDWATYNPLSLVIRDQKLLEKEFEKDKINIRWVFSAGSNKALEFLNAGSLDIGSTAGAAALVARINDNPVKTVGIFSRPEWTALVTGKDSKITKIEDLKGQKIAVTRGTDPHIFLVRALDKAGLTEKDVKLVLLQHADGKTALIESTPANDILSYWRRRRARDPDLWVLELDGAAAERFTAETILQH